MAKDYSGARRFEFDITEVYFVVKLRMLNCTELRVPRLYYNMDSVSYNRLRSYVYIEI